MAHLPRCDYVAPSNTKACPVSESAPGRRRRRVRRLAMAMEGSHMTRNPTRLLPHVAATLLIFSGFPDPTLAQTVSFIARGDFKVGTHPHWMAATDFNGDWRPDLATANSDTNNVSVLLGNGDGTFQAAPTLVAGSRPESVAVGDINRDGVPDLAVANSGSSDVSVLLGNGDGTFQAARAFAVAGTTAAAVAVADLDGDGRPDLAMAHAGVVSVLLGNGDGTFQAARAFATAGTSPHSITVADLNGDGRPDLAVANVGSLQTPGQIPGNVSVLLGDGAGTVQEARTFDGGSTPAAVSVADLNGAGRPDLAVANFGSIGSTAQPGNAAVLLGNGDGSFQSAGFFVTGGTHPHAVAVSVVDGDGIPDLLVSNSGSYTVAVLRGIGNGTFQEARTFFAGSGPASIAVRDFNGDGRPDLAVSNEFSHNVALLLGIGDGTFREAPTFAVGTKPSFVVVGDFNRDTVPDLAVANFVSNDISVLLGVGDGTFQKGRNFTTTGANPAFVTVGDVNGDGMLDLAVANAADTSPGAGPGNVAVLLGAGDGTFQGARTFDAGTTPTFVAVGHVNVDGRLDVPVANVGSNT